MKITIEALRGYLLEEALAYLIKNTGYNLLVDQSQDPQELKNRQVLCAKCNRSKRDQDQTDFREMAAELKFEL